MRLLPLLLLSLMPAAYAESKAAANIRHLIDQQRYADAFARAEKALEAEPQDPYLLGLYGVASAQTGNEEKAFQVWVRALSNGVDIRVRAHRLQNIRTGMNIFSNFAKAYGSDDAGDFDLLFRFTHTGRAGDPTLFLNDSLKSGAVRNWGKYKGPDLDAVLAKLESELDPAKRTELVLDAQRIVARDLPLIAISQGPFHVGLSAKLKDYALWGADYYIIRDDFAMQ